MLIENVEVMVIKVEEKENKEKEQYLILSLATIKDGEVYNIVTKDMDYLKLKAFSKQVVNLNLSSSKYGLNLKIEKTVNAAQ